MTAAPLATPAQISRYFPIISALSRLNFGERGVLEHAGDGIASFAFPAILPQALLFRVFGAPGLILADILIAVAYYAALAVLLRILGISEAIAYCVSLMIVCGVWRFILYAAPSLPLDFWDWRFPRPMVTDLFLKICLVLIFGIYLATDLWRLLPGISGKERVGNGERGKIWINAAASAIMCMSLAASVKLAYKKARGDFDANWEMPDAADQHDYRSRFADLVQELSGAKYNRLPVIGTFDYQVYSWWLAFRNGYALMPDPFYSTITDEEIEQRMIAMCRLLGMNADQFWALISQVNPDVLWLAHWKYNVSNGYTFRPLEDYPAEVIPEIQRTSIATTGRLLYVIPNSEKRRLMAEFNAPAPAGAPPELDLIVLTNGPEYRRFAPPAAEFQKTYENTMFRVFERIPGKGQVN